MAIEKGKTYTVTAPDGCQGLSAKVLSIGDGDTPYKCKVRGKDGSARIVFYGDDDLTTEPNAKGRKKKTSITESLQKAAVADHRMNLDRQAEEFDAECRRMTELAKQASTTILEQVESGELVVNSDQELREAAYNLYKSMGGSDILTAYTSEDAPTGEKVVYSVEIEPEVTKTFEEIEREKREMETIEKVSFTELKTAFEAVIYAESYLSKDDTRNILLAKLAMEGLKTKVMGKEIAED